MECHSIKKCVYSVVETLPQVTYMIVIYEHYVTIIYELKTHFL
ncbi:hypothetical protein MtrunA17_Chr8g0391251 [Medicago truncatula]|uniref:Uncharacterized protein n=1 Tax=Medicago truncatula TaxID=3880 RepID=A0A396GRH2_MEDTR|nr:hypothetical protein MtrunA17_Chr8g0391251 [Medicago truncatula]